MTPDLYGCGALRTASDLLAAGAVTLSPAHPYTWASGLRSPIYCDNRVTLAFPGVRRRIAEGLAGLVEEHFPEADAVVGTATAGIPHAAWVAERLQKPMAYVRSKPKEHGRGNQIEGRLEPGQRVVVVEDTVSTGGSSAAAVRAVQEAGVRVLGVVAIFSYGFAEADARFAEVDAPLLALTTFEWLLKAARASGRLTDAEQQALEAWHRDPRAWSDARG